MVRIITILLLLLFIKYSNSLLKPDSELTTHCYHFPAKDYGHTNNVKLTYGASPKGNIDIIYILFYTNLFIL